MESVTDFFNDYHLDYYFKKDRHYSFTYYLQALMALWRGDLLGPETADAVCNLEDNQLISDFF